MKRTLLFMMILVTPWILNAYKLTQCDFESDYKCEVIHAAGVVVPPFAWIAVWFDIDEIEVGK